MTGVAVCRGWLARRFKAKPAVWLVDLFIKAVCCRYKSNCGSDKASKWATDLCGRQSLPQACILKALLLFLIDMNRVFSVIHFYTWFIMIILNSEHLYRPVQASCQERIVWLSEVVVEGVVVHTFKYPHCCDNVHSPLCHICKYMFWKTQVRMGYVYTQRDVRISKWTGLKCSLFVLLQRSLRLPGRSKAHKNQFCSSVTRVSADN